MSDLDDRIRAALEGTDTFGLDSNSVYLERIKQAFADEGNLKVNLRVKIRLWTPKGYDDYDQTWTPQVLVPRSNKLHKALDARDRSFVDVELLNEGPDLMTGQEWYDRYTKELEGEAFSFEGQDLYVVKTILQCKEAAKRAAGLEINE